MFIGDIGDIVGVFSLVFSYDYGDVITQLLCLGPLIYIIIFQCRVIFDGFIMTFVVKAKPFGRMISIIIDMGEDVIGRILHLLTWSPDHLEALLF